MIRLFKALLFTICYFSFACAVLAKTNKYDAFTVKVTGKGQPILFIPGATCSGDVWNETVAHYATKYQCHVFTLAGYAGTAPLKKGPYLETMRKQIEQYIIDQKLENVILVGHSIGGFMSLCIASEMKDHLQKIVVVDAFPFFAGTSDPNAPDTFSEAKAKQTFEYFNKMDDKAMRAGQLGTAKFLCRDSTHWNQIAEWGATSDKKTFAYTLNEMMGNDMRQEVSSIKVPVLVLGAYCKMPEYPAFTREITVGSFTEQYKACTTCTVHVTEDNARHFIMYDAPQWFLSELDNFIH